MTIQERKSILKYLQILLILVVLCIMVVFGRYFLAFQITSQIDSAKELTMLESEVQAANQKLENLESRLQNSSKTMISLSGNSDKYVKALGLLCEANGVNINKMSVSDVKQDQVGSASSSNVSIMPIALELQGSLAQIRAFIQDLFDSEMVCKIESVSYRQENQTFAWMWRDIDENNMIDWWDITDVEGYLTSDPEEEVIKEEEQELLDANAFLRHSTALCYLQIQIIGMEAN